MIRRGDGENGFVLVVMLLFLLVLSLLAFSVLDISLLENKMNGFYWHKIKSFYIAENHLLRAEQQLLMGIDPKTTNITVDKIAANVCGVTFYRLTATGSYRGVKTVLQCTIAKVDTNKVCHVKPNIVSGRQAFLVKPSS